ncbi:MAG: hypothetical protein M1819_006327 [Sarea resinae]|nr:MAG: hypothetical protein M1819_006327 [Sarea resinae]
MSRGHSLVAADPSSLRPSDQFSRIYPRSQHTILTDSGNVFTSLVNGSSGASRGGRYQHRTSQEARRNQARKDIGYSSQKDAMVGTKSGFDVAGAPPSMPTPSTDENIAEAKEAPPLTPEGEWQCMNNFSQFTRRHAASGASTDIREQATSQFDTSITRDAILVDNVEAREELARAWAEFWILREQGDLNTAHGYALGCPSSEMESEIEAEIGDCFDRPMDEDHVYSDRGSPMLAPDSGRTHNVPDLSASPENFNFSNKRKASNDLTRTNIKTRPKANRRQSQRRDSSAALADMNGRSMMGNIQGDGESPIMYRTSFHLEMGPPPPFRKRKREYDPVDE